MKSLSGKTSNIMIFLVILIVFILILKQAEIVIAQNESNITGYMISNVSSNETGNFSLWNETFSYNLTSNISINENLENTSNETTNETIIPNETSNETSIEPEIPVEELVFDINLIYPEKITRGEIITVKASVINIDSLTARNVVLGWKIQDGFEIISENEKEFCGILEPNNACVSEINLKTDVSTVLGLNEIKVVVSYEV
ncbi:MAG: hypothetical protein GTN40_02235 [Candidatus Aenigmarchaeota archaeon]|nr:hypothetical protein [Candidatus Aenigmarchaeota archaeon]